MGIGLFFSNLSFAQSNLVDLTYAAEKSVHSVVHVKMKVKTSANNGVYSDPFFEFFFGPQIVPQQEQTPQVVGAGSGVIISEDGYIVTNNHVVDGADELEVTLNDKRTYSAKLIGKDPTTDIAVIKIEEKGLPTLPIGNSDDLKIGEWVLAVGNPFNLTSTVTAGIVSAKSRSINIISNNSQPMGIESFIQTDAAVNPGNSGGALVNTKGELVGINTAIASRTGSYSGYSFAVPSSIVRKIVADLKEFGQVQRALLGVKIRDINSELAAKMNIKSLEGVYVEEVVPNGAAAEAGLLKGDIIISIDGAKINSSPQLQEQVGKKRPGEKITIEIKREGKTKLFDATLRNVNGSVTLVKGDEVGSVLNANFRQLSSEEKELYKLKSGIVVSSLSEGKLRKSGIKEGYIIVKANESLISSVEDLSTIINSGIEGLFLSGVYPNGKVAYYAINLKED